MYAIGVLVIIGIIALRVWLEASVPADGPVSRLPGEVPAGSTPQAGCIITAETELCGSTAHMACRALNETFDGTQPYPEDDWLGIEDCRRLSE